MFGLTDTDIADLASDRLHAFSPPEQVLVRLADALTATPADVDDGLYAELRTHFSEEALIELGADIAQENYRARWNRLFDVGSDELYCPIPDHRPLKNADTAS
jgi:alkylhydroperoxidase family enzyme